MQNPFLQTAVECTPHARWTVQRAFMLNLTRFGSRRRMIYFRPRIGWWWRWYKLMESLFSFGKIRDCLSYQRHNGVLIWPVRKQQINRIRFRPGLAYTILGWLRRSERLFALPRMSF